ncbi:MAG: energy transducer TonB [Flavobacterium sp.]|nr:energy transducer TonB [Flavobacterium sp.]
MKKFLFLVVAIFSIQIVSAQDSPNVSNDILYNSAKVDVQPQFSGGIEAFFKFIANHYKMPNVDKFSGKVYVTFVIEIDGSLTDIKVLSDIGYGTGKEAIRVLKLSPKWKPAEQNGQKVRCLHAIPISLQSE